MKIKKLIRKKNLDNKKYIKLHIYNVLAGTF